MGKYLTDLQFMLQKPKNQKTKPQTMKKLEQPSSVESTDL